MSIVSYVKKKSFDYFLLEKPLNRQTKKNKEEKLMSTHPRVRFLKIALVLFTLLPAHTVIAGEVDIEFSPGLGQGLFKDFSEEVGLAISYLPLSPAEPLGTLGVDIGIEVTVANISEDSAFWTQTTGKKPPSTIPLPKIHIQKGLPFGIDIGAVYSKVPSSNIAMAGGEVKWAFIPGNAVLPAVAIRGSYTRLLGVDELDLETIGADLSISKGFAFITPYAGYGQVWIRSKEKAGLNLKEVRVNLPKPFVGVKVSLLLINFVLEADFADVPMYTGRFNIGF